MESFTFDYTQTPQCDRQATMQTINPALLTHQASYAPPFINRPSNPITATNLINSVQEATPSPSPYSKTGRQGLWMGSVGFTHRFTRASMGYSRTSQDNPLTYESTPLEPLFGRIDHVEQLHNSTIEPERTPLGDRMGGDLAWLLGQPQSGYVEAPMRIMHDGAKTLGTQKLYISRGFREGRLRGRV
ncbi:uncharacterized protein QYS62_008743 [Fusarium acuminatum]|uniref:Uncharacterized protein n=1 Tax=Fusarium acuminatum TaxID=5515 RepID=A0ABZ2X6C7_9HYPO